MATNHSLPDSDVKGLVELAEQLDCDLVVVGPEGPLVAGLADMLRTKGIPCFGPHSAGAELEGSKLHAKQVMQQNGVPTEVGNCPGLLRSGQFPTSVGGEARCSRWR